MGRGRCCWSLRKQNPWKKERIEKEEKTERKREEERRRAEVKVNGFFVTATSGWRDR